MCLIKIKMINKCNLGDFFFSNIGFLEVNTIDRAFDSSESLGTSEPEHYFLN